MPAEAANHGSIYFFDTASGVKERKPGYTDNEPDIKSNSVSVMGNKYYLVVLRAFPVPPHSLDINNFGELSRTGRQFLWGLPGELAVICTS